jgi:hypothetical protein
MIIIDDIILGALGNGLYDAAKTGAEHIGKPSKRYHKLNVLQWERLPDELKTQVEQYRLKNPEVGLREVGKALYRALENDAELAAAVQELQTSADELKEILGIGFAAVVDSQQEIKQQIEELSSPSITLEVHNHQTLITIERDVLMALTQQNDSSDLADKLTALLPAQFEMLAFRLNVPSQYIPGDPAPLATRAVALLKWAKATDAGGCGLARVQEVLEQLTRPPRRTP